MKEDAIMKFCRKSNPGVGIYRKVLEFGAYLSIP
jgi:hypothetical protein